MMMYSTARQNFRNKFRKRLVLLVIFIQSFKMVLVAYWLPFA
jgi:hypothetical protein